jgi:hypothetical protein
MKSPRYRQHTVNDHFALADAVLEPQNESVEDFFNENRGHTIFGGDPRSIPS